MHRYPYLSERQNRSIRACTGERTPLLERYVIGWVFSHVDYSTPVLTCRQMIGILVTDMGCDLRICVLSGTDRKAVGKTGTYLPTFAPMRCTVRFHR